MDFIYLKQFFTDYSVSTIATSIIVGIIFILLDKHLKNVPKIIKSYLPVVLSVGATVGIELIKNKGIIDLKEVLILGLLCGSLSLAIISFFKRRKNGDTSSYSLLELSLLEILIGFTAKEQAKIIINELKVIKEEERFVSDEKIEDVLNKHLKDSVNSESLFLLKTLISTALLTLGVK